MKEFLEVGVLRKEGLYLGCIISDLSRSRELHGTLVSPFVTPGASPIIDENGDLGNAGSASSGREGGSEFSWQVRSSHTTCIYAYKRTMYAHEQLYMRKKGYTHLLPTSKSITRYAYWTALGIHGGAAEDEIVGFVSTDEYGAQCCTGRRISKSLRLEKVR